MEYSEKGHGRTRETLTPKPSSNDLRLPALITTSMTENAGMTSRPSGNTPAAGPAFFSSNLRREGQPTA